MTSKILFLPLPNVNLPTLPLSTLPLSHLTSSGWQEHMMFTGLALYYERASKAVTSTQFTKVALTLQDADGNIIENRAFNTLYGEE